MLFDNLDKIRQLVPHPANLKLRHLAGGIAIHGNHSMSATYGLPIGSNSLIFDDIAPGSRFRDRKMPGRNKLKQGRLPRPQRRGLIETGPPGPPRPPPGRLPRPQRRGLIETGPRRIRDGAKIVSPDLNVGG